MEDDSKPTLVGIAAEVASAYLSHNAMRPADVPALIGSVHAALAGLGRPAAAPAPVEKRAPAVPIRKSVTDDYIVSLEDGRKLKSMKRYLSKLGMTPADYRAKWSLPADYPMVAPSYAKVRSEQALARGFGRKPAAAPDAAEAKPGAKRGRPKKVA